MTLNVWLFIICSIKQILQSFFLRTYEHMLPLPKSANVRICTIPSPDCVRTSICTRKTHHSKNDSKTWWYVYQKFNLHPPTVLEAEFWSFVHDGLMSIANTKWKRKYLHNIGNSITLIRCRACMICLIYIWEYYWRILYSGHSWSRRKILLNRTKVGFSY